MTGSKAPVKKNRLRLLPAAKTFWLLQFRCAAQRPYLKNSQHAHDTVNRVPLVVTEKSHGCGATGQRGFMNNAGTPRPADTGSVMLLLHSDQWR